jgi:hypothetical protein
LEKYKESLHPLSYLFVLVYFFILLEAINESTLDKLKREVRDKDLDRKAEVIRRKHVERERVEHVRLTGTTYVKPLASCEPAKEEVRIF